MSQIKRLITSQDFEGLVATQKWQEAFNQAKLSGPNGSAERLLKNDEFWQTLPLLIKKYTALNHYSNTVSRNGHFYPKGYMGPNPIEKQIEIIADTFELDPTEAFLLAKNLPDLPQGAEGWFAVPKIGAVAEKFFSITKNQNALYGDIVDLALSKVATNRNMHNGFGQPLSQFKIRQDPYTSKSLKKMEMKQRGDIIIVAAQFGINHCGKSVYSVKNNFTEFEFGLGAFQVLCMGLTHPERYSEWNELDTSCPGDVLILENSKKIGAPIIFLNSDKKLLFDAYSINTKRIYLGLVTAFIS